MGLVRGGISSDRSPFFSPPLPAKKYLNIRNDNNTMKMEKKEKENPIIPKGEFCYDGRVCVYGDNFSKCRHRLMEIVNEIKRNRKKEIMLITDGEETYVEVSIWLTESIKKNGENPTKPT